MTGWMTTTGLASQSDMPAPQVGSCLQSPAGRACRLPIGPIKRIVAGVQLNHLVRRDLVRRNAPLPRGQAE